MVFLSYRFFYAVKTRKSNFIDKLRIYVRGGGGGSGIPRYGGVGGKGGDVYVQAKEKLELKDIIKEWPNKRCIAGVGQNSKFYKILGDAGADLTIPAPVGVTILSEHGHVLGELLKPGDTILIAKGGKGGDPSNQYCGQKGQIDNITLNLKLIADVGFVGFPNAGKSTLLRALSRAVPKVASYPFTTIKPNVGVMEYEDFRQITLADLPGLIEGAHRNFGLGHNFLKHVERTTLLLFIVDIGGFRLNPTSPYRSAFETVLLLNKEIELYKEQLLDKPAILVVNKMDLECAEEEFAKFKESLKTVDVSSVSKEIVPTRIINFEAVIPITARKAGNTDYLKQKIRSIIDIHTELQRQQSEVQFLNSSSEVSVV